MHIYLSSHIRPALESLLEELQLLSRNHATPSVSQVIEILEEIAMHSPLPDYQRARIFAPDMNGSLRHIDEVYYHDLHHFTIHQSLDYGFPTHPMLSKSLALKLALRFLSSLELNDDDDNIDDIDMGEDLTTRINSVLRDYDINFALNEFLANAADAGASRFSILLDHRSFESRSILCPDMAEFQQGPSLVLHNDAVFSEKDFIGLRRIGIGGKTTGSDTIGKFGLGALSLFHFTDVCTCSSSSFVINLLTFYNL